VFYWTSWGNGGIAPCILYLGTRWRWVVGFTPRPLYLQGKNPWYALDRSLGGPQSRSGRGSEEKNSQPYPRLEPPIIQPVSHHYTAELTGSSFILRRYKIPRTWTDGECAHSAQDIWTTRGWRHLHNEEV
jgi:hypothetical protein